MDGPTRLLKADLVIDLRCPHCVELYPQFLAAIEEDLAAGRLRMTLRFYARRPGVDTLGAAGFRISGLWSGLLAAMLGTRLVWMPPRLMPGCLRVTCVSCLLTCRSSMRRWRC